MSSFSQMSNIKKEHWLYSKVRIKNTSHDLNPKRPKRIFLIKGEPFNKSSRVGLLQYLHLYFPNKKKPAWLDKMKHSFKQ